MSTGGRHRGPSGVDRINALPDELLISILTCLRSTRAAARTSALSRRWRHVWKDLREISFSDHGEPRASVLDAIDAALSASAAAPLDRLDIDVTRDAAAARSDDSRHVPPRARVAGWLHLAARRRRLAGELHLSVASRSCRRERESFEHSGIRREREGREEDRNLPLELPVLEEATAIHIYISTSGMRPSIAAAGTFAALRVLAISSNSFDELDMERVVSTQCPRLQELKLKGLGRRSCIPGDLSIRSSSLERLELGVEVLGKLTIDAPELVRLVASGCLHDRNSQSTAHIIVAPKLAELIWHHAYDSRYHQIIVGSGCHLQRLKVKPFYGYVSFWKLTERVVPTAALFQRFDTLDELHLDVSIPQYKGYYEDFFKDTTKLPKCKALKIRLGQGVEGHPFVSIVIVHLLRNCAGVSRLDIELPMTVYKDHACSKSYCPCCLWENQCMDDIVLDSLEELNISRFTGADHEVNLVRRLLTRCQANPKRVSIRVTLHVLYSLREETCQKIAGCFFQRDTNTRVEFHGHFFQWKAREPRIHGESVLVLQKITLVAKYAMLIIWIRHLKYAMVRSNSYRARAS